MSNEVGLYVVWLEVLLFMLFKWSVEWHIVCNSFNWNITQRYGLNITNDGTKLAYQ
jgi:hypothetical protein